MLLYQHDYAINDHIVIHIPTLEELKEKEQLYYENISLIVSTPYDMMVQLDDMNIDFTTITEWDLFCLLFKELQRRDLSLIFSNLDFSEFETAINKQNGEIVLFNRTNGAVIDREIHNKICIFLRKILCLEKNSKIPANEEAKKYMIERARKKLKRAKKKAATSQLEDYIVALVNKEEFPYDYDSVLKITIYQFNRSLQQIIKKVRFDKLMIGCYAGTVNMKDLDQKELNWISN